MSSSSGGDGESDAGPGTREVAHRVFAAEFDDADLEHSESDEERAPNYVVTPTGLRVNRLFAVGVLTEVESVNEQTLRGRVVDPTGAFVTYAGQYQPDEAAYLDRTTPPAFVALTGKARTFQPEDSDLVYTSVRPESLATVDADTRDRWVVSAAEATLRRIAVFAEALAMDERGARLRARLEEAGVPTALAAGIPLAIDHYGTGTRYLEAARTLAVDALEVVADEREEVRPLAADPGDRGGDDLGPLPDVPYDLDGSTAPEPVSDAAGTDDTAGTGEPVDAAGVADDGVAVAEDDTGAGAEPERVESADAADAGEVGGDDSTAADPADGGGDTDPDAAVSKSESEPDADAEPVESAAGDDLGDFEDGDGGLGEFDAGTEPSATDDGDALDETDDLGEFDADDDAGSAVDPEDFEDALSDEERREVEEEHGVEFSTGSEVPDAGQSDIEVPEADGDTADSSATADPAADLVDEPAGADSDEPAVGDDASDAEAVGAGDADDVDGPEDADIDLENVVVDLMAELDDGDGADREAVVAAAVDRRGADPGDAEDAIQEALMSGKCYEPGEGTLKPI